MPFYNYLCHDCDAQSEQIKGSPLTPDEIWDVIFETSHQMFPSAAELAEARKCPRCGGVNTDITLIGSRPLCYVRGNGYLDRAGCRREMDLHKLTTDDPYAEMREPGEADDLAIRLRKGNQHNPRPVYFPPNTPIKPEATE